MIVGQGFDARLCLYKTDVSLAFMVLVKAQHAVATARFVGLRPPRYAQCPPAISAITRGEGSAQKGHSALTCKLSRNRVEGSKCKGFA